ncbi:unnamed protein product [Clonostachys rosea f. rosea IK726]|uniref:Uncharacterized protein n=2 Tax=Bionectria ochroleuca TaxID=29856 RepID=A0A0B7KNJ8_BIOOC|nr:unnamed protein product [Clonostachys rosea f. rosea IK726]
MEQDESIHFLTTQASVFDAVRWRQKQPKLEMGSEWRIKTLPVAKGHEKTADDYYFWRFSLAKESPVNGMLPRLNDLPSIFTTGCDI